jgi:hypothetical protein
LPAASVAGPFPFHCSARVTLGITLSKKRTLLLKPATVVQAVRMGHETAGPLMSYVPGRLGVGWTLHCVPSHRSATIVRGPENANRAPTAVHAEGEEQETPLREPPVPGGVTAD